jgi:integrase
MPQIRKVTLASGTVRYRFTVDMRKGKKGQRRQKQLSFRTKKEAEQELIRLQAGVQDGTYTGPTKVTVNEYLTTFMGGMRRTRRGAEHRNNTKRSYGYAVQPIRDHLGHLALSDVTADHCEEFIVAQLEAGRGAAAIQLSLGLLRRMLDRAVKERKIPFSPALATQAPAYEAPERPVWTDDQARTFLTYADRDRLAGGWWLVLHGLRRGEILGLQWEDIDFAHGLLTIHQARVRSGKETYIEKTKSERGNRTLPIPDQLLHRLSELKLRQEIEAQEAGPAYTFSGYAVADEAGLPVAPEWFSRRWRYLVRGAGLPAIRLHDGRHASNTLLAAAGVPDHIRAAWLGHTTAVNNSVYTHVRASDLVAARDALTSAYTRV